MLQLREVLLGWAMQRIIGLMSGTSVDGIDAVLVDVSGAERDLKVDLIASQTYAYRPELRQQILEVCAGAPLSVETLMGLDDAIAQSFAEAAISIQSGQSSKATLIGSHGQTVFHRPPQADQLGCSLQLGRGEVIAHRTGIKTVCNFRAADIAAGGQGAPLVPKIDVCLLSHATLRRCVQNLGGIGNVAVLPPLNPETDLGANVKGWDTGPSNVLLDLAITRFTQGQQTYDAGGQWAAQGSICQPLVERWLQQPFFQQAPPKSTGRELFSPAYLEACLTDAQAYQLSEADMLATLTELTAASIVHSYRQVLDAMPDQVLLCGGGSRNTYLRGRIQTLLGEAIPVLTTDDVGLNADAKEAIAFAVLAHWRVLGFPGNLPSATGAAQAVLLGELHAPWKLVF
jgi:anhydro-N-acetylmuramic acid kinase